ncbi:MAG: M20 family peptidase [Promethearchaeota archaeon]|nr:MAG: M20 family peptidase [Candidatus Lokiarchaeota archaeon]
MRRIIISEEIILKEIEDNREEFITFLQSLIQTNSYNPPGNEKNVAVKIRNYLKDVDIDAEIFEYDENRANLIATLNDDFEHKNLLFNGHMDVVPPGSEEDWKYPPLSAYIKRNKYMYGRGTTDMKGGLAAMVCTMKVLKKLKIALKGNLLLNAVADEEMGGTGTEWSVKNPLKSKNIDFTIIGEPTALKPLPIAIMVGERGRMVVKVTTNGISTHASWPFMGKNAIYIMSDIIQKLNQLDGYIPSVEPPLSIEKLKQLVSQSFPSYEVFEKIYNEQVMLQNVLMALTRFTKSLTIIKAGVKDNVVPDKCEAYIDFRLLPGQKGESIIDALKKVVEQDLHYHIRNEGNGKKSETCVDLEIVQVSEPSYWKDWESSKDLKVLQSIINEVFGVKTFIMIYPASADAHYLRNSGFCEKTILFGPGSGSTAHSIDENIEICDFINAIKVYSLFAYRFLQ